MTYSLIIIPIIVVILTQILKLSIDKIKGNLNLKNIFISYGGMPSAHTALAISIVTMIGLTEGVASPIFAVALIFTLIIMRDAITFRNILGKQGKLLNQLIDKLSAADQKKMPHFLERVGHSASEVFVGAIWGVLSTLLLYFILNSLL
jgi:acid phosphatase family membrane protein YuiD